MVAVAASAQTRLCRSCDTVKSVTDFYFNKKSGYTGRCKTCIAESDRIKYLTDPEKYKAKAKRLRQTSLNYRRMRKSYQDRWLYGVDPGFRERLWAAQHGCCAICRTTLGVQTGCIDHDHVTGQLRGMLCRKCNSALGLFQESPELLSSAASYLEHWKGIRP